MKCPKCNNTGVIHQQVFPGVYNFKPCSCYMGQPDDLEQILREIDELEIKQYGFIVPQKQVIV